jgi:hypothetical protein
MAFEKKKLNFKVNFVKNTLKLLNTQPFSSKYHISFISQRF